jgi:hypothetical protein
VTYTLQLQFQNAGGVVHPKMLSWEYSETPMEYSKLLHEVQDSQHVAQTCQSSSEDTIALL